MKLLFACALLLVVLDSALARRGRRGGGGFGDRNWCENKGEFNSCKRDCYSDRDCNDEANLNCSVSILNVSVAQWLMPCTICRVGEVQASLLAPREDRPLPRRAAVRHHAQPWSPRKRRTASRSRWPEILQQLQLQRLRQETGGALNAAAAAAAATTAEWISQRAAHLALDNLNLCACMTAGLE